MSNRVTSIGEGVFGFCSSLTSIGYQAFRMCRLLKTMFFSGSVTEWDYITKGDYWNYEVPATKVICSDGEVML
ncbi:MAG: hypothetical protein IJX16_04520 [Clostridia bacterium]|nr:hypothetical protein [Clostridia bacterium]